MRQAAYLDDIRTFRSNSFIHLPPVGLNDSFEVFQNGMSMFLTPARPVIKEHQLFAATVIAPEIACMYTSMFFVSAFFAQKYFKPCFVHMHITRCKDGVL